MDSREAIERQVLKPTSAEHKETIYSQLADIREARKVVQMGSLEYARSQDYGNYWASLEYSYQLEGRKTLAEQCRENQEKFERLEQRVVGNPDANPRDINEWYLSLGALNRLDGNAEQTLLEVADVLNGKVSSGQHRVRDLVLLASMYSEASICNEEFGDNNAKSQEEYERKAFEALKRAEEYAENKYSRDKTIENLITLTNIKMYGHDLRIRDFERRFVSKSTDLFVRNEDGSIVIVDKRDKDIYDTLEKQQRLAILQEAKEIARLVMGHTPKEEEKQEHAGLRAEVGITLLLQEQVIRKNFLNILEARKAFGREDFPHDGFARHNPPLARQGFDIMLTSIEFPPEESEDQHMLYKPFVIQIKSGGIGGQQKYSEDVPVLNLAEQISPAFSADLLKRVASATRTTTFEKSLDALLATPPFQTGVGLEFKRLLT